MHAFAPGSCGELVQGLLDGQNFLITCPISWYSRVQVDLDQEHTLKIKYRKTQMAVEKTLQLFGQHRQFTFSIKSDLPHGKGMASSSADIAAACVATARALSRQITAKDIEKIALSIEPTDGIFYKGIVAFGHLSGYPNEYLGQALPIQILVFDTGSGIDTLSFNKRPDLDGLNRLNAPQIKKAYDMVKTGFSEHNPALIGQGATISAFANQSILYKAQLQSIYDIAMDNGALGVNVAHSGSVVGVLFFGLTHVQHVKCQADILAIDSSITYLGIADLVNGGVL